LALPGWLIQAPKSTSAGSVSLSTTPAASAPPVLVRLTV
jgi:hypothetical protein